MKKILSIALAILMIAATLTAFTSCGKKTDVEYIKNNKKLVVGVTDYAPFDYEKDGKWVGFDADMARKVGEKLGVEVEFIEIDWDEKITELQSKKIDVIWNGMTKTDELAENMDFSYAYAQNCQVVVIKKANAATFNSLASLKGKKIVAESGSAGEDAAVEEFGKNNVTGIAGQTKALMEVNSNTADAAVVDYSLAMSLCGTGSYADLMMVEGIAIGEEEFAVGVRKGSDLTAIINEVLVAAYKDGSAKALQDKYGANDDGSNSIALCDLSNK